METAQAMGAALFIPKPFDNIFDVVAKAEALFAKRSSHQEKVKAYPIPAQIVSDLGPAKAEILKLTYVGFMAEIGESKIQAGDKLEVTFEFPVVHLRMKELGVVVKLYNQFAPLPKMNSEAAGKPEAKPATSPAETSKVDRHGLRWAELCISPRSISNRSAPRANRTFRNS